MKRKPSLIFPVIFGAVISISFSSFAEKSPEELLSIADGRYLVQITGCNDCHTTGWVASGGKISERDWLMGDVTGWSGPWGTTYAPNLRFFFQGLSEDAWVTAAHIIQARPPMPWWSLRVMKEGDLRNLYRLVKSLGLKGQQSPSYLPPGQQPKAPYFLFFPPSQ